MTPLCIIFDNGILFFLCLFLTRFNVRLYAPLFILIAANWATFQFCGIGWGSQVVDLTPLLYILFVLGRTILHCFPMNPLMTSQTPCRGEFLLAVGTLLLRDMRLHHRHISCLYIDGGRTQVIGVEEKWILYYPNLLNTIHINILYTIPIIITGRPSNYITPIYHTPFQLLSTDQSTGQSTGWPTGRLTKQPAGRLNDWLIARPSDQPADWPTYWLTNQPTNRPTNQRTGRPTGLPTNWPTDWMTGRMPGRLTGRLTNRTTGRLPGRPTNRSFYWPTI